MEGWAKILGKKQSLLNHQQAAEGFLLMYCRANLGKPWHMFHHLKELRDSWVRTYLPVFPLFRFLFKLNIVPNSHNLDIFSSNFLQHNLRMLQEREKDGPAHSCFSIKYCSIPRETQSTGRQWVSFYHFRSPENQPS